MALKRLRRAAVILTVVAGFCTYLVSSSCHQDARPRVEPRQETLLLSSVAPAPAPAAPAPATPEPEDDEPLAVPAPPPPVGDIQLPEPELTQEDEAKSRSAWALVTAYCPCRRCCGRHANGTTSTGSSAWSRGVAAAPGAIAYGIRVFVPGYGYALVDDTGGAMRRVWRQGGMLHLDVRMSYHWQARQWGKRLLKIRVYDVK